MDFLLEICIDILTLLKPELVSISETFLFAVIINNALVAAGQPVLGDKALLMITAKRKVSDMETSSGFSKVKISMQISSKKSMKFSTLMPKTLTSMPRTAWTW
jgi:hypothetical protein